MSRRSGMLRFESQADLDALKAARRDRFNRGQVHTLERDVLASVLELLKLHPRVAWAMRSNTGSGFLIRRDVYDRLVREGHLDPRTARFMQFGVKGAADITGMLRGGRRFECETKSDTGKVTDDQQAFGDAVNGGGGLWIVARSTDDVMRELA